MNGTQVLQLAKLADPPVLQETQGLRFVYKALAGQRHYGRWINADQGRLGGPRTRSQARSQQVNQAHALPTTLLLPRCRLAMLNNLAPVDLLRRWNALAWTDAEVDVDRALSSVDAFTRALPRLQQRRTPDS